ncbi:MAG: hypothetical protein JOZ78_18375 [Chroococcidiopsidaceae cyanobacterium CP_BM_ER_R8_30]|nr:hypothetical protein [Chroococcidiopsidaceae cyanobacterium CP_BM_ER_R8_30]
MNEADRSTNAANPEAAMVNPPADSVFDEKNTSINLPATSSSHSLDSVALTQKVQFSSNIDLLNQVNKLRQALAESQQAIKEYKEQANVRESLLSQHVQELATTQTQLQQLWHELETSHQTIQRQQILIETLTVQFESSQERVAQLEREFALNQQRYNEQSYQLVQLENDCRELRSRLSRQQSHTLQFKVALEKCLEVPLPKYQFQVKDLPPNSSSANLFPQITNSSRKFRTAPELPPILLSRAQSIPPWSISSSMPTLYSSVSRTSQQSITLPEASIDGLPIMTEDAFVNFSLHSSQSAQSDEVMHLSSVDTPESIPTDFTRPQEIWQPDNNEPEQVQYQDLFSLLEVGAESTSEFALSTEQSETPISETTSPTDSNWPSPVVYPSRPPKGRKSFAAVELPIF